MKEQREHPILLNQKCLIQEVWRKNYEEELYKIMELTKKYNVIAMDTEFPGVNSYPQGNIKDEDFEYSLIRSNVNNQKIIQIGISICDEEGLVPEGVSTWQFNFQFDLERDQISPGSRDLLQNAGIDFRQFLREGLRGEEFSEFFIGSGIATNENLKWVAFHGGFDFGYFFKMLYGEEIPEKVEQFSELLKYFFPQLYDIKYLVKDTPYKEWGLQRLASELKIDRYGPQHQAGSDSLLTLKVFYKLKQMQSKKTYTLNLDEGLNIIYGIGKGYLSGKTEHYMRKYRSQAQSIEYNSHNYQINNQNLNQYMCDNNYDMSSFYPHNFMLNLNQFQWSYQQQNYPYVVEDNQMHHKQDSYGRKKQNY